MSLDKTIVEITKEIHNICENTDNFKTINAKGHTRDGFTTWSKTNKGLIIYYTYGSINSLITPYGELKVSGSCSSKKNGLELLHSKISNTFDLELYKNIVETEMGCYGPWYTINSFNGVKLDKPKLIENNIDLDYHECKKKYKELFGDY